MSRTVDLVIDGGGSAARAAATAALQRGRCVLVVLRSGDGRVARRFRKCLCKAANVDVTQLTVMTNAEVVCVDGVDGVEAVVVRYTRTGHLCAVNTPAFLSCDGSTHPPHAGIGGTPHADSASRAPAAPDDSTTGSSARPSESPSASVGRPVTRLPGAL